MFLAVISVSCRHNDTKGSETDLKAQAETWYKIGITYQSKNEDSSFYYYEKALQASASSADDTLKPYILFRIAMLHYMAFNYKEALEMFDSAMKEGNRNKNFVIVSDCLNELGNLERDLNDTEQSRSYFNKALHVAEQHHLSLQAGVTLGNIASFAANPDSSLQLMNRALTMLKKIKGAEGEYCTILSNMANNISDSKRAIKLFHEVITIAEKGHFSEVLVGAYNNLACTYLENNLPEEAEKCLRDHAIPLALKTSNIDWLSTVYESYAEIFEKKGDFHQAYSYQKKALKTRIEASQKQAATQMRLLNALFRSKNREIEIREKGDEIKAKHDQLNRAYGLSLILLLSILLLAVISLWWIQRKNLKLKILEINTTKRLSAIEEKEHERLSMQLHDTIGPLSSILMKQIESIDFPVQDIKLAMITRLTETTQQLRRISHRLNPLMRDQMTFTELIRDIREDFQGRSGLNVNLSLPEKEPELPIETINQLYFILQELMMNATKHVKSGKVTINIFEEFDNLYLLYEDDGPGFSKEDVQLSGLGLMHIIERAKLMNGKAVLDSTPGKGTRWTISIPLKNNR